MSAALPPKLVAEVVAEVRRLRQLSMVPLDDVRQLAGRSSWAAGVGPAIRNYLEPLWAVIGEMAKIDNERAASAAAGDRPSKRQRKSMGPWVHEYIVTGCQACPSTVVAAPNSETAQSSRMGTYMMTSIQPSAVHQGRAIYLCNRPSATLQWMLFPEG